MKKVVSRVICIVCITMFSINDCVANQSITKNDQINMKEYSKNDVYVNLKNKMVYEKNSSLVTGLVLLEEDKSTFYYNVQDGLIKSLEIKSSPMKWNIQYQNEKITNLLVKVPEGHLEAKLENGQYKLLNLEYGNPVNQSTKLEYDNNEQLSFSVMTKEADLFVGINNSIVKYTQLSTNKLMKTTDFANDDKAQKMVEQAKQYFSIKFIKPMNYNTVLYFLYKASNSSISEKECQEVLGEKGYQRLLELYNDRHAVLMQCETKLLRSHN